MQTHKKQRIFGAGDNLGVPQGSPFSPVLANMYLDELDEALLEEGHRVVRYADDFVILCRNYDSAARATATTKRILSKLALSFNADKTRLTDFDNGFVFLGHYFIGNLVEPIGNNGGNFARAEWIWDAPSDAISLQGDKDNSDQANHSHPEDTISSALPVKQTELQDAIFEAVETRTAIRPAELPQSDLRLLSKLRTLYVAKQGAIIHKLAGKYVVRHAGDDVLSMPINQVDSLMLFGAVQLTHGTYHHALQTQIPVMFMSMGGHFYGLLCPPQFPDIHLLPALSNIKQHSISKELVKAKISNTITVFRRVLRYTDLTKQKALYPGIKALKRMHQHIDNTRDIAALRGYEGNAARISFSIMKGLIAPEWGFTTRNRRPPRDPVNVLLSFGYTVLYNNIMALLSARNLPLNMGCLHQGSHQHPALVLDMMEPFRAPIVDASVIKLINSRALKPDDFSYKDQACLMGKRARQLLLETIEAKLQTEVTYRQLGLKTDYRRVFDMQALVLKQFLRDERDSFCAFRNR